MLTPGPLPKNEVRPKNKQSPTQTSQNVMINDTPYIQSHHRYRIIWQNVLFGELLIDASYLDVQVGKNFVRWRSATV